MPRRSDRNQLELMNQIRQLGATVTSLHEVGNGVPDLLVGYRNQNFLFEVKDPQQPPSKRKLTLMEQDFHESWRGNVHVIMSIDDVIKILSESIKIAWNGLQISKA